MRTAFLWYLLALLFFISACGEGEQGETGPTGIGQTGAIGESGSTGEVGPTGVGENGVTGPFGDCYQNAPPQITDVTSYEIVYLNRTYPLIITATDDQKPASSLDYQGIGAGGHLIQDETSPNLFHYTPESVGGPIIFTALVSDGCQVAMKEFEITSVKEDTGWEYAGSKDFSGGDTYFTSLSLSNGIPYLAFCDEFFGYTPTIMKLNQSQWEPVGYYGVTFSSASHLSLFVYNATPFIAFALETNPAQIPQPAGKISVMAYRWNGSSGWANVGASGVTTFAADNLSLYVYQGTPYVAFKNATNQNGSVLRYNGSLEGAYTGTGWEYVGETLFSSGRADWISLVVFNGTPYVAYRDHTDIGGISRRVSVRRLNDTSWEYVGPQGISEGGSKFTSLAIDDGNIYVAYRDHALYGKASVKWYNGSVNQWEYVGQPGFSEGIIEYISLQVENGTPFVAFTDGAEVYGKVTVMKYSGGAWELLGQRGFSEGPSRYVSLAVQQGIPYVGFGEGHDGWFFANVMKFQVE